jgi:glycosyltransferase involved in cell wall biosynthesis
MTDYQGEEVELSVVIPVYDESPALEELHRRLKTTLDSYRIPYELIFVDDGSGDASFPILKKLHGADSATKIIRFRKNFGKAAALRAGFKAAEGKAIITLDSDLQDVPEEIPKVLERLEEGFDLVSGWKQNRQDPLLKRISSRFFNLVVSLVTGVKVHDFNCGMKGYRREVVQELELYGELYRFIPAIAHWKGFRVGEVKVAHHPRLHGKTKYGVERYWRGVFDLLTVILLTKYTHRPLHFFGLLGASLSFAGFGINLYLALLWFSGLWIGNRPLLLLGILLMIIGIQFIFFGLMAELIVYSTQRSEVYVVMERLDPKEKPHRAPVTHIEASK